MSRIGIEAAEFSENGQNGRTYLEPSEFVLVIKNLKDRVPVDKMKHILSENGPAQWQSTGLSHLFQTGLKVYWGNKLLLNNQMFSVSNVSVLRKQRIQCSAVCSKLFGGLWDVCGTSKCRNGKTKIHFSPMGISLAVG